MNWLQQVFSFVIAPAAIAGGVFFLAKLLHEHLLDRAMSNFAHRLEQKWHVRTSIQSALVSAYEAVDEALNEHLRLVDENLLTAQSRHGPGIVRLSSLGRVEMFVDLWVPELDDALAQLQKSIATTHAEYHRLLELMQLLDQHATPVDELVMPVFKSPEERQAFQPFLALEYEESDRSLEQMLVGYLPGLVPPRRGDQFHVDAVKRLLRRNAVLPLLSQPVGEIQRFKEELRKASRRFLRETLT